MLKLGYNVLFQDADLVWFRNPFPYFHRILEEEQRLVTFFSDDGQRSMRYTPFYANSGFYYLPAGIHIFSHISRYWFIWRYIFLNVLFIALDTHTVAFAYQIMISFDSLYTMGSHQNIFTTKLMEMMDVRGVTSMMLDLSLFPTGMKSLQKVFFVEFRCLSGVQYHHNKKFMERFLANNGSEAPYGFHMCWTSNKREKIKYFKVSDTVVIYTKCLV